MKFIRLFEEIRSKDIASVGGKNASLGEMIGHLSSKGVLIPSGFAIVADAYRLHLSQNKLEEKIKTLLEKLDKTHLNDLQKVGHSIREMIMQVPLPQEIIDDIQEAYLLIEKRYGALCDVAVRSSATAEDLPEASFAGQQETFLNIRGIDALLGVCTKAFASLFTDRAISYRVDHGFDHMSVALSIGVQKMVRSDQASSGVMFTLDTESGFKDVVYITSSYGLGETIVQGAVCPDELYIHKSTFKQGFKPMLKKRLGSKLIKMVYAQDASSLTQTIQVDEKDQRCFSISDDEAFELARQAVIIEDHYSQQKGQWSPMDIEWAKDGIDGKLYIVQARPETVHANRQQQTVLEEYVLNQKPDLRKIIVQGKSVGRKIAIGVARIISAAKDMNQLQAGEILITDMTDPDWEPIMKIAAGIVTNRGGRTCHAAIISRELGIPAIVGTHDATSVIKTGQHVTIDCSSGESGFVYEGSLQFSVKKTDVSNLAKLPTHMMMNVGNPDEAMSLSFIPNDGVGLARLEFIINNSVKIHPMALVHPERVTSEADKKQIAILTNEYVDKKEYFIDKLAQEAGTIAASFYPKPVIVRLSDFKSNEYRQLIAGDVFEPVEENPMLGFRGALRYYHEHYREAFALECAALKKIRDEMGLTNVKIMVPFVRNLQEGKTVIEEMSKYGLKQSENGLEIIMMCEIPSNVILIDQFSKIFDGFSIGSNDLTQLTLAVDRDSDLVAGLFDERDEAVVCMLEMAIRGAQHNKKPIGICGQAPSDYPEIAKLLMKLGISSMSLNPDSVIKTWLALGEKNKKI